MIRLRTSRGMNLQWHLHVLESLRDLFLLRLELSHHHFLALLLGLDLLCHFTDVLLHLACLRLSSLQLLVQLGALILMLHGKLRLPIHLHDTLDITAHALINRPQLDLRQGAEADWQPTLGTACAKADTDASTDIGAYTSVRGEPSTDHGNTLALSAYRGPVKQQIL